jgi:hypothetical protein
MSKAVGAVYIVGRLGLLQQAGGHRSIANPGAGGDPHLGPLQLNAPGNMPTALVGDVNPGPPPV